MGGIHSSIFELSSHGEIKGLYTLRHFSDAFWRSWLDLYFKNADTPWKQCRMTNPHVFLRGKAVINELSSYLKLVSCTTHCNNLTTKALILSPVIFIKHLLRIRHSRENMSLTLKTQHLMQVILTTAFQKYLTTHCYLNTRSPRENNGKKGSPVASM